MVKPAKVQVKKREKLQPLWWRTFAEEYLKTGNASKSYRTALPGIDLEASHSLSYQLINHATFSDFFEVFKQEYFKKAAMSRDELIKILSDTARFDLTKFFKENNGDLELVDDWKERSDSHVITHVKCRTTTLESGQVVKTVEIEAPNKMKAAEVLARAAGLTSENVNVANISINIIQQLNALHEAYEEGKLTEKEIPIDTMKDMKLEG
jgi:hypothetical protein